MPDGKAEEQGVPLYAVPDKLKKVVVCNNLFSAILLSLSVLHLDFVFVGGVHGGERAYYLFHVW